MHKKNGKVYATLTDVKNLIGDVFAAVDEYGEVAITSYNKTKYLIVKAPSADINEIVEEIAPKQKKSGAEKKIPAENLEVEVQAKSLPVEKLLVESNKIELDSNDNLLAEAVIVSEPEENQPSELNSEVTELNISSDISAETVETSKDNESTGVLEIFKKSSDREFFDRSSEIEKSWANKVKLNF